MRVRAIRNSYENCPPEVAARNVGAQTSMFFTIGKEYEVYALSVLEGVTFLQIITDIEFVSWKLAWFFEVIDASVPDDWICSLPNNSLALILGPAFVAADDESYNRMVEEEPESVEEFWRRIREEPTRLLANVIGQRTEVASDHSSIVSPASPSERDPCEPMQVPAFITIEETPDGVFMYRRGSDGQVIHDTWHVTIEDAQRQARYEFRDVLSDWKQIPRDVKDLVALSQQLASHYDRGE